MTEKKTTTREITTADVLEVRELLLNLAVLPPAARQKIQYIIEGAKLVTTATDNSKQGGAA